MGYLKVRWVRMTDSVFVEQALVSVADLAAEALARQQVRPMPQTYGSMCTPTTGY